MGIRTACFVLAVVSIGHWFMWVFLAGLVLPADVAVILANAGAAAGPGRPRLLRPGPGRRARLESGPDPARRVSSAAI